MAFTDLLDDLGPDAGKPAVRVLLAEPRGFCAGVERAIRALDEAVTRYGPPIYVRHHIVHNPRVVSDFEARGVIFVEDLDAIPQGARVLFSAHGVPKAVQDEAARRRLRAIDTTCPLVTKVHSEVRRHAAHGRVVILIGHRNHVEVIGILGNAPEGTVVVIETKDEAERLDIDPSRSYAYATQTTLSADQTAQIIGVLKRRIGHLVGPRREDICYATTNRQAAVKALADRCDVILVMGGRASSNSQRLVETARDAGCARAWLIETACELDMSKLFGCRTLGITSGASTPDALIDELLARLRNWFSLLPETLTLNEETLTFRPASLAALA